MSKNLVKMLADVYPYGCKGDVVGLEDQEVADLDKLAKVRKTPRLYEPVQSQPAETKTEDAPSVKDEKSSEPEAAKKPSK